MKPDTVLTLIAFCLVCALAFVAGMILETFDVAWVVVGTGLSAMMLVFSLGVVFCDGCEVEDELEARGLSRRSQFDAAVAAYERDAGPRLAVWELDTRVTRR